MPTHYIINVFDIRANTCGVETLHNINKTSYTNILILGRQIIKSGTFVYEFGRIWKRASSALTKAWDPNNATVYYIRLVFIWGECYLFFITKPPDARDSKSAM